MTRSLIAAAVFFFITACSGSLQGPPDFEETFGTVDEPCAAAKVVVHCTAHVYLVNHGDEGAGHATVVVTLKDLGATTASPARKVISVKCGRSIPDTSTGAEVDVTCSFDLPPGKTVAAVPILQAIDFTAAGSNTSGGGTAGMVGLGLAALAALLSIAALGLAIARRSRPSPEAGDDGDAW